MRRVPLALLLAACGDPPPAAPAPTTPAERLVGTWALDPVEAGRWDAWRATLDGREPRGVPAGAEGVVAFLKARPDHPDVARLRDTLDGLDAVRLVVTPSTLEVRGATGGGPRAWTILGEAEGIARVETRDPATGAVEVLAVAFDDAGRLQAMPEGRPQDAVRWRRVP